MAKAVVIGVVDWPVQGGFARLAIDGSESEPTLLTANMFSDYGSDTYSQSQRLLGIHGGELLVSTMIVEQRPLESPEATGYRRIVIDGGIHTVVPEGQTPRMLTDHQRARRCRSTRRCHPQHQEHAGQRRHAFLQSMVAQGRHRSHPVRPVANRPARAAPAAGRWRRPRGRPARCARGRCG